MLGRECFLPDNHIHDTAGNDDDLSDRFAVHIAVRLFMSANYRFHLAGALPVGTSMKKRVLPLN